MSALDVLTHADTVFAFIVYSIVAGGLLLLTAKLSHRIDHISADSWSLKTFANWYIAHIWIPLIRVFALLVFILLVYPHLFGLENAPSIRQLLFDNTLFNSLINSLFLISLLLPLLPVIGNAHFLILPLQGIFAVALLINRLLSFISPPANIQYFPTRETLTVMIVFAMAGYASAVYTAEHLGDKLDEYFSVSGCGIFVYQLTLLIFQAPVIIAYGLFLGAQL